MAMYAARGNASWAEAQSWASPRVISLPEQERWMSCDQWPAYRSEMLRRLRKGGVAVHIDIGSDVLQVPGPGVAGAKASRSLDLWSCDAWNVVQALRPGSVSHHAPHAPGQDAWPGQAARTSAPGWTCMHLLEKLHACVHDVAHGCMHACT